MSKEKLEGYSRVAVIEYDAICKYYFALYDDGYDYKIGDTVALSEDSNIGTITDIISLEEYRKMFTRNIISEVIGKVDTTAYEKRVKNRKERAELKKKLDQRKKEVQARLDDEYYASNDEEYAEMLRKYNSLK